MQPLPHRLALGRPRTSQPSARGRRTPKPRTAPTARGGERAPGRPPTPARPARPRPAVPRPGPTCGGGMRTLPLPRPRPRGASPRRHAGRALRTGAEPPSSVSRTPRPPAGAGDRFPAAGRLSRCEVGPAVRAPAPGARRPTDALGRQWEAAAEVGGACGEMGGASAHRRGPRRLRVLCGAWEAAPPGTLGSSTWADPAICLALDIESPLSGKQRNSVGGMTRGRDPCVFPLPREGTEGFPSLAGLQAAGGSRPWEREPGSRCNSRPRASSTRLGNFYDLYFPLGQQNRVMLT